MRYKILYSKGYTTMDGKQHPKHYPHWDKLLELLKDHDVQEIPVIPLPELKKLLLGADVVICTDSFIQHFCWSIGKKAIVLWGQSDPEIFGHKEHINLLKDRKYLRAKQFWLWSQCEANSEAFVLPEEIIKYVSTTI